MVRVSFLALLALSLLGGSRAQGALPPASPTYQLTITPQQGIQTCQSARFGLSIFPTLSTILPVSLTVSIQSADGSFQQPLSPDVALGETSWVWSKVIVPLPGLYMLEMISSDPSQYDISSLSAPFTINFLDTSCLSSSGGSQTAQSTTTPPTSSSIPATPSNTSLPPSSPPPPASSHPSSPTLSPSPPTTTSATSSSSSDVIAIPSNVSAAAHSSAGLKAGVSVAVVAVVLGGAGALYWLLISRRRRYRSSQTPIDGCDRGYNGLGSRDDYAGYPADAKGPADPLGRTFGGGLVGGGLNPSSYLNMEEKSAQSTSAVGGGSSDGATAGHGGLESVSAFGYAPPAMPKPTHNQSAYSTMPEPRSAPSSSTSHETQSPLEANIFETSTSHSTGSAMPTRRGTRKPVPAYGDLPRESNERRDRASSISLNNPSYASSINELSAQGVSNTLNHKTSFGDSKPMNHVLMPDLPLSQN